ncbi:MAG: spondin domain-containing protein, partial [Longimicrobiales bacterium]
GIGHNLHFATMFVQSNDLFYAPDGEGIALYDGAGAPITGDVTDQVMLWDAGTEADEEPGVGANQAPRQGGPDTGDADGDNTVRIAVDASGNIPAVDAAIEVTVTSLGDNQFTLRIENIGSDMTTSGDPAPILLAPGVYAVGGGSDLLFTEGAADTGSGLEALAEDGDASTLAGNNAATTGVTTPIAPGVWAVHTAAGALFTAGAADSGAGLEGLAEDGDPAPLNTSITGATGVASNGVFNTPVGASGPGPVGSGASYSFSVMAEPGDYLSFATMFIQSNDAFYAPSDAGIALFSGDTPTSGDVTSQVMLWDAGTEVNEEPGVGSNQAPRQAGADTGTDEGGNVRLIDDGFTYPSPVLRVTITPAS